MVGKQCGRGSDRPRPSELAGSGLACLAAAGKRSCWVELVARTVAAEDRNAVPNSLQNFASRGKKTKFYKNREDRPPQVRSLGRLARSWWILMRGVQAGRFY